MGAQRNVSWSKRGDAGEANEAKTKREEVNENVRKANEEGYTFVHPWFILCIFPRFPILFFCSFKTETEELL